MNNEGAQATVLNGKQERDPIASTDGHHLTTQQDKCDPDEQQVAE